MLRLSRENWRQGSGVNAISRLSIHPAMYLEKGKSYFGHGMGEGGSGEIFAVIIVGMSEE